MKQEAVPGSKKVLPSCNKTTKRSTEILVEKVEEISQKVGQKDKEMENMATWVNLILSPWRRRNSRHALGTEEPR